MMNESGLTGESGDIKKSRDGDCFLLSSCLVASGDQCRAMVIAVGPHSQWGHIKASLFTESVNTPLQDQLETMTELVSCLCL
jgi:magnesium-transporting ATPase (P-type)